MPYSQFTAITKVKEAFNLTAVDGSVSNGLQWQFLKLSGTEAAIDLNIYPLPPVEQILGFLIWMVGFE
jgi:hypothetical protein